VRADEPDEDDPGLVLDRNNEPIPVPADVEDDSRVAHEARVSVLFLDVRRSAEARPKSDAKCASVTSIWRQVKLSAIDVAGNGSPAPGSPLGIVGGGRPDASAVPVMKRAGWRGSHTLSLSHMSFR
jgi:hypothetical protein